MSTVVFNPTHEEFKTQYVGEAITIPAGKKLKMDDPRARHILNELGQRGLCRLDYGDDEKSIAAEGIERNREFRMKQIITYNQMNEARRQQNQSYMEPPKHVKEYAKELGTGLITPYAIKDQGNAEIAEMKEENRELRKQLGTMQEFMQRLIDAQEGGGKKIDPSTETPEEAVIAANQLKYKRLGKTNLKGWIENNREEIGAWPEENRSEIRKKYLSVYGQELKGL